MARRVKLDHGGIGAVLKSAQVRAAVRQTAESVAGGVHETTRTGDEVPVTVAEFTSDRAAASVTMAHPAGLGIEGKRGSLARAAAAAGLEVTQRAS